MRQIIMFIFSGAIGGLVVFAGLKLTESKHTDSISLAPTGQMVKNVNRPAGTIPASLDFTVAAEKAMPAVVHIEAIAENTNGQRNSSGNPLQFFFGDDSAWGNSFGGHGPKRGTGSGVFISQDGYIVTNNHVVSFANIINVTLYDNRKYEAELVGRDEQTDLAVLKIEGNGFPVLGIGDSDRAKVGEWVLAVGNPFDLTSTVTAGIISAKGRNIDIIPREFKAIEAFIQTDAAVNPGNSGGALVDASGDLIGINTAIATRTGTFSGYSFAIPVNMMQKIVDDIIKYGSYQRGFLGINIGDMDADLAEELGVSITQGVYVDSVVDGGAAQYAGITPKDIIVSVNGKRIKSVPELQEVVGRSRIGDVMEVKLFRDGDYKQIPVKLTGELN